VCCLFPGPWARATLAERSRNLPPTPYPRRHVDANGAVPRRHIALNVRPLLVGRVTSYVEANRYGMPQCIYSDAYPFFAV
jgi:hypothetical protein